jgi:hypothetical protein
MIVNGKQLAGFLNITGSALTQLANREKIRYYRKPSGQRRYILQQALDDYDKNVYHGYSLNKQADKIDDWFVN